MNASRPGIASGPEPAGETTPTSTSTSTSTEPPERAPRRGLFRFFEIGFLLAALGAGGFAYWRYPAEVASVWKTITGAKPRVEATAAPEPAGPSEPWNGSLTVSEKARAALGIVTAEAKPQTEPLQLELLGTTEYISDTLTKVRPMFEGRVDKVHVTVGQSVKKGDPLIDLYSTALAEAKSAYEIEQIQWLYDRKLLEIRESLLQSKTVSQQLYDETKNNEMKNRREYEVARDKLLVYGLTEAEVEQVEHQPGSEKARLTLRSPADGLVITRDVAVGNLYDQNDTLLVIAPMDHLWVWGNVFESNLDLVELGQSWEIQFPFLNHKVRGKVEFISNRVDPTTHAVRVRTSIPNPEGTLKSDMLVRSMLEIPPVPGRVVIPRTGLVHSDRHAYVFVQTKGQTDKFERRNVEVAQEKGDQVIIHKGLEPAEKVVTVGGLILAQMYEDLQTTATGAVASDPSDSE